MTTTELAEYYAGLLIIQYIGKLKAYATVRDTVYPILVDQMPLQVQDSFDIETAVGVQLDTIGKYIGASRYGYGLSGQPIALDDEDYRKLIKLIRIKNNSGSSLYEIQQLLAVNFPSEIFVSDNTAMGLNYLLLDSLGTTDLLELIVTGGYLPRPMAVEVSATIIATHEFPFFGVRTYDAAASGVSPLNSYDLYNLTYPMLTYDS
jgi:hypothetical protein